MLGETSLQNQLEPPLRDPVVKSSLMVNDIWLRYFNNLYQQLIAALQKGVSLPSLTTAQRDADPAMAQQRWFYNTTASQVQIGIGGTWYFATLTATT